MAGSAYAMAKWVHLEDSQPGETIERYRQRVALPDLPSLRELGMTPRGISRLEGLREGEWFEMWETTLIAFIREAKKSDDPITLPPSDPMTKLDGY